MAAGDRDARMGRDRAGEADRVCAVSDIYWPVMSWRERARFYVLPVAIASAVAVAACLLPVPGVLVGPMVIGAGHVAQRVNLRRIARADSAKETL